MKIRKFDLNSDDLSSVAAMILNAYREGDKEISFDVDSEQSVRDLVEIGNNFIGHENIYLCFHNKNLSGLFIAYSGKSYSNVKTLLNLLIRMKLNQVLSYLVVSSRLFDTIYTPNLKEDDLYISVIFVDPKYRNQGIGTFMLEEANHIAKEKKCKRIVLDVNQDNIIAQSLYKKFGFNNISTENSDNDYYSMEYVLI